MSSPHPLPYARTPWFFVLLLLAALLLGGAAQAKPPRQKPQMPYGAREDVRDFIREMVERHGFVERELAYLFSRARREPAILAAITPPKEPKARSCVNAIPGPSALH